MHRDEVRQTITENIRRIEETLRRAVPSNPPENFWADEALLAHGRRQVHVVAGASMFTGARRYYRITAAGKRSLDSMLEQWAAVGQSIQRIICTDPSAEK